MYNQNQADPHHLDYIEKQVEAIKAKHNISSNEDTEKEPDNGETRKIEDILEEQLGVLQNMQHTLERMEAATSKKGWKRFF